MTSKAMESHFSTRTFMKVLTSRALAVSNGVVGDLQRFTAGDDVAGGRWGSKDRVARGRRSSCQVRGIQPNAPRGNLRPWDP
jgi:hypothetical protein